MKDLEIRFFKNSNKAFTIIELLVVISIIGLLSSVIVVSVSAARDKGRIASGIQFSSSLYQAKGLELVGEWKFDEGGGNTVTDSSGNGNDGISSSGSVTRSTDAPSPNHGKSLSLNGSYNISIPDLPKYKIDNRGFTYSAWIKPTVLSGGYNFYIIMGRISPYISIFSADSANNVLYLQFYDDEANNGVCTKEDFYGIRRIYKDKWYHVAATVDGVGKVKIYVDGKADIESPSNYTHPCHLYDNSNPFFAIGSWYKGWNKFYGFIDEARFYNGSISYSQVQKLYAEGRASHQNN